MSFFQNKKTKKILLFALATVFALSFFSFGGKAEAGTVVFGGVTLESGKDNILTYSQAQSAVGMECIFDRDGFELSTKVNRADFYCEWNKVLKNNTSVVYKIIYPQLYAKVKVNGLDKSLEVGDPNLVGNKIIGYEYKDKSSEPTSNSSGSGDKIKIEKTTIYYLQNDTLAGDVRPKIRLSIRYTDSSAPGQSVMTEREVFDSYSGTFEGAGDGISFAGDYTKITIGGDRDTGRPQMTFTLKKSAKLTGHGATNGSVFYFYSDNASYKNLAIRLVHNKEGEPVGVGPGEKYRICAYSVGQTTGFDADTRFVLMSPSENSMPKEQYDDKVISGSNTTVNTKANIYFNKDSYFGFFKKYYNGAEDGKCPPSTNLRDSDGEELANMGAKPDDINVNIVGKTSNTAGESGVCPTTLFEKGTPKFTDLFSNDAGIPTCLACYALSGIEGFDKWIIGFFVSKNDDGGGLLGKYMLLPSNIAKDSSIVIQVWKIIRDIINALVVIAFLLMAFVNILVALGVDLKAVGGGAFEPFQVKKMIPTIVITVFLVNYSLSISQFLVNLSNAITSFFLKDISGVIFSPDGSGSLIAGKGVIFAAITVLALFAYAVILLFIYIYMWVRKIFVYLLFMFSGIPYIQNVLPIKSITKLTGEWWGTFTKWVFMAPILALLLYITARIISVAGTSAFTEIELPEDNKGKTTMYHELKQKRSIRSEFLVYIDGKMY